MFQVFFIQIQCKGFVCVAAVVLLQSSSLTLPEKNLTRQLLDPRFLLHTCRLLQPHNCVIQVACQSCKRSSQAYVGARFIYMWGKPRQFNPSGTFGLF